jgi:pilus assembly protein CpaC
MAMPVSASIAAATSPFIAGADMMKTTTLLLLLSFTATSALAQTPEPPSPQAAPRATVVMGAQSASRVVPLRGGVPMRGQSLRVAVNKTLELTPLPADIHDIIVGNPDIADVLVRSPTQVFVVGRGLGQTNITFRDRSGRTIGRMDVDVHMDVDAVRDALHQVLPDESGLSVSAVGDALYLSGTVKTDAAATTARSLARRFVKDDAAVVNLLRVANEQQVLIRVKVAEIRKTALKELGVSDAYTGTSHFGKNLSFSNSNTQPGTNAANLLTFGAGALTQPGAAFTALTVGIGSLSSTLSLLEQQNLLRTLEEPNLTAVSGETATMLAGGEFPVPVSVQNGQIAIEFKKFGVGLSFTPTVLDPGRIGLKLQTEVSDVDRSFSVAVGNLTVFGLKVRRAGSVVEMPSGGSIMIAGLLQNDMSSVAAGLPGMMDVPILGQLFRSNSFQHSESELIVIVSAFIVQPSAANQMMSGTDGFAPTSDLGRLLLGRLQDIYTRPHDGTIVPPQLQGPVGYIVD